jgi:hypothetical protein
MACLLAVGFLGIASMANSASAGKAVQKPGDSAKTHAVEMKRRARIRPPPIAPSYLAYDYPYYYSRGHYPTHIGPGYIYYGHPYLYSRVYRPRYVSRCAISHRRCSTGATRRQSARRN